MDKILGSSWKTTLVGAVLAALTVYKDYMDNGSVSTSQVLIAVVIAFLGRLMADASKVSNTPPQG